MGALDEVRRLLDDAAKVIAYYLELDSTSAPRTGTIASFSMRELGEDVLGRMQNV